MLLILFLFLPLFAQPVKYYFGWIEGKCLMIFLLMKINQFDINIKTLIKDCFGLVILRSSNFLKPFLNMISERLYHECTVFWNSPHLYLCDVDACYHVGVQSENSWRTRKGFPRLFWGETKYVVQSEASILWVWNWWGIFIHKFIGGLGPGLGWLQRDVVTSLVKYWFYGLKPAK